MQDNRNEFISGEIEGVQTPSTPERPAQVKRAQGLGQRRTEVKSDAHEAIERKVKSDTEKTLDEFYNRPLADPNAKVLCRDDWGRKIEVHAPGWEKEHGITRRFTNGQVVYTTAGIMAHTLKKGSVYGDEPTYIQTRNNKALLDMWAEEVDKNGMIIEGQTKRSLPPPIRCQVVHTSEITIGLCPMYEVVVDDPRYNVTGLMLLHFPNNIVDDQGIDGYGNKHKEKEFYVESDIVKDRTA